MTFEDRASASDGAPAIRLEETFALPIPPDEAWVVLNDVPRIAHCMPGTRNVETVGPADWRANVGVKVGPLGLDFVAQIHSDPVPGEPYTAHITMEAEETSGKGVASVVVVSRITPTASDESQVSVSTSIEFRGTMARHLRGPIVVSVGRQMTKRFALNLREEVLSSRAQVPRPPWYVRLWRAIVPKRNR